MPYDNKALIEKLTKRFTGMYDARLIAKECVRQMDWAQREALEQVDDYLPDGVTHNDLEPMTVAPEDWQPE